MMRSLWMSEISRRLWVLFRILLLIGLSFVILYPLLFMLSTSFKTTADAYDPTVIWLPKEMTLENITLALEGLDFWNSLKNTLLIGGASSVMQVACCAMVGYGFARYHFKESKLLFLCVLFTIIVPPQVISVPQYQMYRFFTIPFIGGWLEQITGLNLSVNLIDNPLVFYIPAVLGVGIRSGVYIFVFRQFFKGVPKELEEAATVDGCGAMRTFVRIMTPNAGPAFLTVFLFSFVWYWNDYFLASSMLTKHRTLAVALSMLRSGLKEKMGGEIYNAFVISAKMQAGALLTILPLIILFIFLQRYFTESIERTGIVG